MARENVLSTTCMWCGLLRSLDSGHFWFSMAFDCFDKSSALLCLLIEVFWLPDWRRALLESGALNVFSFLSTSEISGRTLYLLLASLVLFSCFDRPMSLGKLTLLSFKSGICLTPAFRLSFTISMLVRSRLLIDRLIAIQRKVNYLRRTGRIFRRPVKQAFVVMATHWDTTGKRLIYLCRLYYLSLEKKI